MYPLVVSLGPMAATLANFYYSMNDPTETFGIKNLQAYGISFMVLAGLLVHGLIKFCSAGVLLRSTDQD